MEPLKSHVTDRVVAGDVLRAAFVEGPNDPGVVPFDFDFTIRVTVVIC